MTLEAARVAVRHWIEVSDTGTALVVELFGELDAASRDSTEAAVVAALTSGRSVIIDLADVTFVDSSGVATLIAIAQKAEAEGTLLSIRNAPPNVRRIFEIAGLDHEFDVRD
jgi:anti-anti-sigma factor